MGVGSESISLRSWYVGQWMVLLDVECRIVESSTYDECGSKYIYKLNVVRTKTMDIYLEAYLVCN